MANDEAKCVDATSLKGATSAANGVDGAEAEGTRSADGSDGSDGMAGATDATDAANRAAAANPNSAADAAGANGKAATQNAETAAQPTDKLWTPLFIFIIVAALCAFMVGQGLNSGTSVYLDHMGQGATLAGALAAVFSGAAAVARLACGPLIDNVGRVSVMLVGAALLFAGTVLPVLNSSIPAFVVARILQGVGFSAATTASATAASDVLPLSRMGEGIGYYGLGQALAMSVGPAFALFLVGTDPAENLFVGMAVMAALSFAFALLCRYEKNPSRLPATASYRQRLEREAAEAAGAKVAAPSGASASAPAADASGSSSPSVPAPKQGFVHSFFEPRALPGMLPMLVLSPAFGFGIFFMGLYGTSLGYANAGLFYTVSAIAMIAIRLTSKAFMDSVAPIKIMTGTVACGLVGFAMVLFAGVNELLFYAAAIPYGLCLGIAIPLNQSVAVKNTPPERWGATNALYLLASDIGIGVASAVWGIVNDAAGFSTTIICAMCCIAASLVVAWIAYPKEK